MSAQNGATTQYESRRYCIYISPGVGTIRRAEQLHQVGWWRSIASTDPRDCVEAEVAPRRDGVQTFGRVCNELARAVPAECCGQALREGPHGCLQEHGLLLMSSLPYVCPEGCLGKMFVFM
jgi:hypothetical protein